MSPAIARKTSDMLKEGIVSEERPAKSSLSKREKEVLLLMVDGMDYKEIVEVQRLKLSRLLIDMTGQEGNHNSASIDSFIISGLARNRTWIWSFGNSHTIHCTTRPVLILNVEF